MINLAEKYISLKTKDNTNFYNALTAYNQPNWNNPSVDMWFKFGISTNERGEGMAKTISKYKSIDGSDCLDVGCAYGGFLVAFKKYKANKIVGFDINQTLLNLAEYNFADNNFHPNVSVKDVTKFEDIKEFENQFDIITCNDVIEHVDNPEITFKHISQMLKKNGIVSFEIPNKNFPYYVMRDGHYTLYGITLLEYEDAKKYYNCIYPTWGYDVKYYLDLEEYEKLANKYGLSFKVIDETYQYYNKQYVINDLNKLKANKKQLLTTVPMPMQSIVSNAVDKYILEIENVIDDNSTFKLKYGAGFWTIICEKF